MGVIVTLGELTMIIRASGGESGVLEYVDALLEKINRLELAHAEACEGLTTHHHANSSTTYASALARSP